MTIANMIDTLLNVGVFVFIGILIWLYFKKETDGHDREALEKDND